MEAITMKKGILIFINAVLLISCVLVVGSVCVAEDQFIKPADAEKYVGKEKTVCGGLLVLLMQVELKVSLLF